MRAQTWSVLLLGMLVGLLTAQGSFAETVAERFEQAMKKKAEYCKTHKIDPANRRCDILKLKPADPLATEEGRFAHSIKIPNPVPEDSGYKPGMTSEQYFDHLCKTEAGEFIYKTVENVEGLYQMRPRPDGGYAYNHLYAPEDPYGGPEGGTGPGYFFVEPGRYHFFEASSLADPASGPDAARRVVRYFGYDGRKLETMKKEVGDPQSRYGYTWRGISRPHDREFGIGGSEMIVLDLTTHEVLAVYRGYVRFEIDERFGVSGLHWTKRCPDPKANIGGGARLQLLLKVVKPAAGF